MPLKPLSNRSKKRTQNKRILLLKLLIYLQMSHSIYGGLASLSFVGVIIPYILPIVGGLVGTAIICFSNSMIISMALKNKCSKKTHVEIPTVELTEM